MPGPNVCAETCVAQNSGRVRNASAAPRRVAAAPQQLTPTVTTTAGEVQGTYEGGVEAYLGVPFAEAPVAELRWAPPQPITSKWSGVYQATQYGASCLQSSSYYAGAAAGAAAGACQGFTRGGHPTAGACRGYSEDCLNLNIFTPSTSGKPRAVMAWIHGGCFVAGSASNSQYNGSVLAATHDVLIVTLQYRLGALGFLADASLRPRDPQGSTGNYGLLDNVAALEWLQANIAQFGGDPQRVTIFGESSGAGSVSQLLGVQPSWPLFQRAIMESGTAAFWTYISVDAAKGSFDAVVNATECAGGAAPIVDCLLQAPASAVTAAVRSVPCRDACTWAPVVDGVLVRGKSLEVARAGGLRPETAVISGWNLNDGASFVPGWPLSASTMSASSLSSYFSSRFGEFARSQLAKTFPVPARTAAGWLSKPFYAAQLCETDFSYACTAEWLASALTDQGQAHYVYQFSQPTYLSSLAVHGDEIGYVFGTLSSPSESQAQTSAFMTAYWANFAKYGDPNADGLPTWPQWSRAGELLNITSSPTVATTPDDSFHGCPLFYKNWDYYGSCLPP